MNETYSTDHIYSAAHLVCQGIPFIGAERANSGRVRFVFGQRNAAEGLDSAYRTGRAPLVNPKHYETALFRVRDAMRAAMR